MIRGLLVATTDSCFAPKGETCDSPGAISQGMALLLFVLFAVVVFTVVSITDIVKEDPTAQRAPRHRRREPPREPDETTADRLESAAERTGRWQAPFAWMNPGTITGKLTMAAWLSRWWASGSYMRRRLLVSIASSLSLLALIALAIVVLD